MTTACSGSPATRASTVVRCAALQVIIVDDGSRDGTARAAAEFVRKHGFDAVRVLRLPCNRGKGYAGALAPQGGPRLPPVGCAACMLLPRAAVLRRMLRRMWSSCGAAAKDTVCLQLPMSAPLFLPGAVKSGMLCARGQRLLMMDADGATKVSDLERLEAKLAEISSESVGRAAGLCMWQQPWFGRHGSRHAAGRIHCWPSTCRVPAAYPSKHPHPSAGRKEEPVSSPSPARNGKAAAAARASSAGGLGFVLGSRAHMQVRRRLGFQRCMLHNSRLGRPPAKAPLSRRFAARPAVLTLLPAPNPARRPVHPPRRMRRPPSGQRCATF